MGESIKHRQEYSACATLFLCTFTCIIGGLVSPALAEPFVSGFDRFGRHGDIESVIAGKLLVSELSCTACHATGGKSLAPKRGPHLHDAGTRLSADWVRQFLTSPHQTKPGTTMPDLLAGKSSEQRIRIAEQLTAYLMNQTAELPEVKGSGAHPVPFEFWNKGDVKNGRLLYHRVGCVACHAPDASDAAGPTVQSDSQIDRLLNELDPEELAGMGLAAAARRVNSVPHADLATKYSREALTHFLISPSKFRPGGRMPDFKLSAMEAADIAAYLQRDDEHTLAHQPKPDAALVEQGRNQFLALGCIRCHTLRGVGVSDDAMPLTSRLDDLDVHSSKGCLNAKQTDYSLEAMQSNSIRDALASNVDSKTSATNDQLALTMLQLNCLACHTRDERGGVGRYRKRYFHTVDHVDLGDEGRLPPPLEYVGRKLTKTRMKNVLAGRKADVRPHMYVRMPVFPNENVAELADQLARVDQTDASKAGDVFGDTIATAVVGRRLMDVGCVQCHAFGGHTLPGVVGVDLDGIATRVHPRWFHDFLLNPGELKARTRMPTFFPDGKSQHPGLLDGSATRQIGAMWAYLADLPNQKLPEKIEAVRSQDFELIPKDRPIVLRTFVEGVGTHAIAVGFPEGVHYAFDTQASRLALGWRGRFMDAQGTWFIRFAPPAVPLGDSVIQMPSNPSFVVDPDVAGNGIAYRYEGYRLDENRIPAFSYQSSDHQVSDRIVPAESSGLRRTLTMNPIGDEFSHRPRWLRVHSGKTLDQQSNTAYVNDRGLTVSLTNPANAGIIREIDGETHWFIPLDMTETTRIEVLYSW